MICLFLISSPEYNSSYSSLFKNAIDWVSRKTGDQAPMATYRGKVAAIMAASLGSLGGMWVLVVLRMLMKNLGTMVLPNQKTLGGDITNEKTEKALKDLGAEPVDTLKN
ncbi:MAG: chromate reductase [Paraglaciecola sp.]